MTPNGERIINFDLPQNWFAHEEGNGWFVQMESESVSMKATACCTEAMGNDSDEGGEVPYNEYQYSDDGVFKVLH